MVRVKFDSVLENYMNLSQQARELKGNLKNTGTKMMAVPESDGFSGTAQKNILNYTQKIHKQGTNDLAESLDVFVSEYKRLLEVFHNSVDNSNNAIIDTEYLAQIKQKLNKIKNNYKSNIKLFNSALVEAESTGANVFKLNNDICEAIDNAIKIIDKLHKDTMAFNSVKPNHMLETVSESVVNVNRVSNALCQINGDGKQRFKNLSNTKDIVNYGIYRKGKYTASFGGFKLGNSEENHIDRNGLMIANLSGGLLMGGPKFKIPIGKQASINAGLNADIGTLHGNFKAGINKNFKGVTMGGKLSLASADANLSLNTKYVNVGAKVYADYHSAEGGLDFYTTPNKTVVGAKLHGSIWSAGASFEGEFNSSALGMRGIRLRPSISKGLQAGFDFHLSKEKVGYIKMSDKETYDLVKYDFKLGGAFGLGGALDGTFTIPEEQKK